MDPFPRVKRFDGRPFHRYWRTFPSRKAAERFAGDYKGAGSPRRIRIVYDEALGRYWLYRNPCGGVWWKGVSGSSRGVARRAYYAQKARMETGAKAHYRQEKTEPGAVERRRLAAVTKRATRSRRTGRAPF